MTKSDFDKWFVEQHGTRHAAGDYDSRTDFDLQDAIKDGRAAEAALRGRQLWDARKQSALYAWVARDA